MVDLSSEFKYSYKVTLNHVSLSSLGKIFDYWAANIGYEKLIVGYEFGDKQGQPHFQVYIQNSNISTYEQMRIVLCHDLYEVGVIGEKMTCVAFPLDDPNPDTLHYLAEYAKKGGHYIAHYEFAGAIECRWDNVVAQWNHDKFYSKVFDHYRENTQNLPNYINHVKTWG